MNISRVFGKSACMLLASFSMLTTTIAVAEPIQISPVVPGFVDPILANNPTVMDDFFTPAFYPGSVPYLNLVTGFYNLFLFPSVKINPCNDRFMLCKFEFDQFLDSTGVYNRIRPYQLETISEDGGRTWGPTAPFVQPTLSLGGTLSQEASFESNYSKLGSLLAVGVFNDMHTNPPRTQPRSGLAFSRSEDNGNTWSDAIVIDTASSNAFRTLNGPYITFTLIRPDKADNDLIHIIYSYSQFPTVIYGNVMYVRSEDGGETWSTPRQIYVMEKDPFWFANHVDTNFSPLGGSTVPSDTAIYDEDTVLVSLHRQYPKQGSPIFNSSVLVSNFDKAMLRSFDKGITWNPVAGETEQFIAAFAHDPAGVGPPFTGNQLSSGNTATPIVVSNHTGRIYMSYIAGNTDISSDPLVAQGYPRIVMTASSNIGATWTKPVQVNRTPTNIPIGNQQAFRNSMTMGRNGEVIICYYDFRNWTGGGLNDPLQTDVWMDIYKETDSPTGGSTGIGLDFIREERMTPTSFDARISLRIGFGTRSITGLPGFGTDLAVNDINEVFAVFGTTHFTPPISVIGYKGMTENLNNVINLYINSAKLTRPGNQ